MRLVPLFLMYYVVCGEESPNNVKLPSYLKPCKQTDPNLNECVKKSVENLKPMLIKGIPELSIPSLEPLCIPKMIIDQGSGTAAVKSTYTDIKVHGASGFNLKSVKIDLEKDRIRIKFALPHLRVTSKYTIDGRILMMPIIGSGQTCGNYSDIDATVTIQGQRVSRNNETYFNIKEFYVDFILGHATIHLDNLFNGDKKLGDAMNEFLNDNWKNVTSEIKPVLEDTIARIFKKLANSILRRYPLSLILPS